MSSATPFQVVIVGGGIAGLSAAIALRKAGRHITVPEQSRLHSEIGATISLQPNASRILEEEWQLGDDLAIARGMVDHGFRIYNVDGTLVNTVPLLTKAMYGAERIMYHRQDLHECLKQAALSPKRTGQPVEIRVSSRVISCDCEAGIVTLQSGETVQGDLIIGADGIHSKIREQVLEKAVKTIPTGLSAYRFLVPRTKLEQKALDFCKHINPREPYTLMVMAHSCRLIMGPAREGELYSVVGLAPDEKMLEDPDSKQYWVSRGDLALMLETYKDFPECLKEPFSLATDLGLWQLRDIDPLETWVKGRTILIGDG
jgi:salicylate hydroxylase